MRFRGHFFAKGILVLIAIAALGYLVMLLWNAVVPVVFAGVHPVDYWRALGLLVLSRVLFGGFRGRGYRGHLFERLSRGERDRLHDFWRFAAQQHDAHHDFDL
jgi:hypothetical protein